MKNIKKKNETTKSEAFCLFLRQVSDNAKKLVDAQRAIHLKSEKTEKEAKY